MDIGKWPDRIIRWGFYLLFGLVPLLLTPWNYELFEFNKMMAVYALTVVITGAWVVKSIGQKELRIARTPLDIPVLLFLSSQLLSAIFSIDPHVSWFGYYSRFNGGMLSVISYVLLYYAFVSNLANWAHLTNLIKLVLATGAVVALYGVAERLGIDKNLWVQDVQNRVFSTLGQPNWLAAYLVALSPIAMALSLRGASLRATRQSPTETEIASPRQPAGSRNDRMPVWSLGFGIWTLTAALFFLVLLFTRSRSGLLGFAVADVVFWGLVFIRPRLARQGEALSNVRSSVFPFLIIHSLFFLIIFFNGTYIDSVDRWMTLRGWRERISKTASPSATTQPAVPAGTTLLETGGTDSGILRRYVWIGAINAWRSSLKNTLVGTGTETFAFAFYRYKPKEHNRTSEGDYLYNKAHNEYLNYLATTGILGLGSYLIFIGACIVWFSLSLRDRSDGEAIPLGSPRRFAPRDDGACKQCPILNVALFSGWASILVTNFFGFSVVVVQLLLFLFPAMAIAAERVKSQKQDKMFTMKVSSGFFVPFVLLVSLVLLVLLSLAWYADTLYAAGYRASRAGQYDVARDRLSRALTLNPGEPQYADELGSAYAGLVTVAVEEKDATKAAQFVKQSLASSDRALATSPKNVNFWKTRTKIYYAFSQFDPAFNDAAIEALEQAQKLSPNDPKITYNLAILYGRKSENDKAIDTLKATIDLKPNYRDAYYALWVFYTEIKKPDLARTVLEDYLAKVDPGDKDFQERLNQ